MSNQPTPPRPEAPANLGGTSSNHLSADVEIKGTVTFDKALVTHGRIEGEVHTTGHLTVGKTGRIQGDIHAGAVSLQGIVNGNVKVQDRCELKGSAELIGDLEGPRLVIEDGVTFIGRANVTPRGSQQHQQQQKNG